MKTNWFVFTGSPSSGKTTLLNQLEKCGFPVVRDEGREYFDELKSRGLLDRSIEQEGVHQLEILKRKLKKVISLSTDAVLLFDYGLPCSVVWGEKYGVKFTSDITEAINSFRYKGIFILEKLSLVKDDIRIEDENICLDLEERLYKKYSMLDYKTFKVKRFCLDPDESVQYRKNFVLDKIGN
jgi:predicted ATPase